MTTKELLEAELEKLTDEDLAELLTVARGLSDSKAKLGGSLTRVDTAPAIP